MTKTRKACIVLFSILTAICVGIDGWWLGVKNLAPDKITDTTIYAQNLQKSDGTKANIFEVNYYSNANNNGYEMFELKVNYLTDSTADNIYSQGIQYIASDKSGAIKWQVGNYANMKRYDDFPNVKTSDEFFSHIIEPDNKNGEYTISSEQTNAFATFTTLAYFQRASVNESTQTFTYSSSDDFATSSMLATNPINDGTHLLIQIKDEKGNYTPFGLGFRGTRTKVELENAKEQPLFKFGLGEIGQSFLWWNWGTANVYPYYDINYVAYSLYNAVKSMPAGTNQFDIVEFGDWFDYFTVKDNELTNVRVPEDSTGKVKQDFTSYYAVKVNVNADGAQRASRDSLFKMIKGSSGFNIDTSSIEDSYFYGRAVAKATVYDLDFVLVADEKYAVKLNNAFIQRYKPYKDEIRIVIEVDLDILKANNMQFVGLANNAVGEFVLDKCYTLETQDGQVVKTEVTYA